MEKKSTKPVRARILLTLLILILAIIFGVIFVYRDNIKALWRGLTTDTGEIGEMIQETQTQTKNALSDAGMNVSEDDFNKLNNGDLSQEEIEAIIYDSLTDASNGTADPDSGSETPADDEKGDNADSADGKTTGSTDTSSKDPASGTGKDSSQASGGQTGHASGKTPSSGNNPSGGKNTSGGKTSGSTQTKDPASSTMQGTFSPQTEITSPNGTAKLSEEEYNKKVSELVAKDLRYQGKLHIDALHI